MTYDNSGLYWLLAACIVMYGFHRLCKWFKVDGWRILAVVALDGCSWCWARFAESLRGVPGVVKSVFRSPTPPEGPEIEDGEQCHEPDGTENWPGIKVVVPGEEWPVLVRIPPDTGRDTTSDQADTTPDAAPQPPVAAEQLTFDEWVARVAEAGIPGYNEAARQAKSIYGASRSKFARAHRAAKSAHREAA